MGKADAQVTVCASTAAVLVPPRSIAKIVQMHLETAASSTTGRAQLIYTGDRMAIGCTSLAAENTMKTRTVLAVADENASGFLISIPPAPITGRGTMTVDSFVYNVGAITTLFRSIDVLKVKRYRKLSQTVA